jgi:hypothetical protein
MPSAPRTGRPPTRKGASRGGRGSQARGNPKKRSGAQSLEHRILLTTTMCLLAFGAVMVYSASSATTLLP